MRFSRLKLNGFKSFAEATELYIEPGLTGIVGPNGCGKSNVVEGLRWAMGETSAKQLRGGDMYDIIFAGSANRAGRNVADVTITLDNADRSAPAQFNDSDELIVSRRIERDKGSVYRINGRDVRARDVQLLFADAATGARSPALVSQGKIGALINAKPSERRVLLEDAAGIGGLHARRHEAELKLKQAEANLERLDDVLGTMESQVNSLLRQVRQAKKYRELSKEIQKLDALRAHIRWVKAQNDIRAAESAVTQTSVKVAEAAQVATATDTARAHAGADLPPLRQAEAEAGAALHRLQVERDHIDREKNRVAEEKDVAEERVAQLEGDLTRENRLVSDAQTALQRLEAEQAALLNQKEAESQAGADQSQEAIDQLRQDLAALEAVVDQETRRMADAQATRAQLTRETASLEQRVQTLDQKLRDDTARLKTMSDTETSEIEQLVVAVQAAEEAMRLAAEDENRAVADLEQAREDARAAVRQASEESDQVRSQNARRDAEAREDVEKARRETRQKVEVKKRELEAERTALSSDVEKFRADVDAATESYREATQTLSTVRAEAEGLARLLEGAVSEEATGLPPLLDFVTPHTGYEAALGAALGDDLLAPVVAPVVDRDGTGARKAWSFAHEGPEQNGGAESQALLQRCDSLWHHVTLSTESAGLVSRLQQVGVVDSVSQGQDVCSKLSVGQRIVSRDGHLWRWDGYHSAAGAADATADILRHRNRLSELDAQHISAEAAVAEASQSLELAKAALNEGIAALRFSETALEKDLQTYEQSLLGKEQAAKEAWDTVRTENSVREGEAAMTVRAARQAVDRLEQDGRSKIQSLRQVLGQKQAAERASRTAHQKAVEAASAEAKQRAGLEEAIHTSQQTRQEALDRLAEIGAEMSALPVIEDLSQTLGRSRQKAVDVRAKLADDEAALKRAAEDAAARDRRLQALAQDLTQWDQRYKGGVTQSQELDARLNEARQAFGAVKDAPQKLVDDLAKLDRALEDATSQRNEAAKILVEKEEYAQDLERKAHAARDTLQSMRESHVRAEAALEQANAHLGDVLERIAEDINVEPSKLAGIANMPAFKGDVRDLKTLPSLKQADIDLDRVKRQRDAIGPVNLRAEVELEEVEGQFGGLRAEKEDLLAAIGRLRTAIEEINTEGRERLLDAFGKVNVNFSDLFTRLFGGGAAHLALIENEDPLAAGLEVMASPPGKKLQAMSLLSGGEQALTALSLLFAVFLVNPAPICVLDEVDAPLDDANVERFCNLLDQMAQYRSADQETRFLVVSHHPLTMARMNRLFGVTMSERGVSTLVSVDLEKADNLRLAG